MPDRRFVITDLDPAAPEYGKLLGLAANTATGIAIPSFQLFNVRPAVGTEIGQAVYESTTRRGWVWDGTGWQEIAASPVKTYVDEATLKAAVEPSGTFAVAADVGSIWVRRGNVWAQIGTKEYATAAALLADTPAVGSLGLALDDGSLWEMTGTGWRATAMREFPDTAAVTGWTTGANPGDNAIALDVDVVYVRTATGWKPATLWSATEAQIRAATWALPGQEAIATDTGRVFARTNAGWVEEPIQHYPTEAALLAATPQDGVLAWADSTNVVFTRASGTWHRLQGPQVSTGPAAPSTPGAGDMHLNAARKQLEIWDGANWQPTAAGGIVGTIMQSVLTEAQFATAVGADAANWMLADGRSAAGTRYATITGRNTVPDLRGAFLRMAGQNANPQWTGPSLGGYQEDSTARPDAAFTTDSQGAHFHHVGLAIYDGDANSSLVNGYNNSGVIANRRTVTNAGSNYAAILPGTDSKGAHTHTITGGGDAETRPKSYGVNYFIRVN